jgi:hypothetical protein
VTPTFAVPDLLGRVARFQLAQRVADRGEGYLLPSQDIGFSIRIAWHYCISK